MSATAASVSAPPTGRALAELSTPLALVDGPRVRANIATMQEAVAGLGASLRPHFKTHRTLAIARLQRDAGAVGLTVATVQQLATVTSELGWPVLVSSLLQADGSAAAILQAACAQANVIFAIESRASVERLREALGPELRAGVAIEVEAGCKRSGATPGECGALARIADDAGFDVAGVFSYPGHSYVPGQSRAAAEQERSALGDAAAALRRAGFDPQLISAGSTPSMPYARSGVVNEYRPGTYVFGDRQQLNLGAVARSQLALSVVASVVARHDDRVVLDAGGKALGRDAPRWLEGFGELAGSEGVLVTRLYDHHAVIEGYTGKGLSVGDRVAIVPNNANSALALARSVWMTDDGVTAHELRPEPDR